MNLETSPKRFQIHEIDLNSPHLEAVVQLHSAGKARLGPFPRGAFEDHAARRMILVAVTPDCVVAGYLLFRIAKNRAVIVHLTTSEAFRKTGVARTLVNSLKERSRHLPGICLSCRRDYNVSGVWQSFGFTVRHSRPGRGAGRAIVDYWWFDHNHEDLFSQAASRFDPSEAVLTAMDANIFYDLVCEERPHSEDTRVLDADWLQDSVVLCVTYEIYNEIHRSSNEAEKKRCRTAAQSYRELKTDEAEMRALEAELAPFFNGAAIERDTSDMRQVAHAIVAEVPFFVTRDTPMLGRSDVIFEKYGLRILHPTDLVNQFDILRREAEYRPARLEGSNWRERLVVAEDVDKVVSIFKHPTRERINYFEQRVRHFLAHPNAWGSSIISNAGKVPTIYLVQSKSASARTEIPILRHAEHPLAGTLVRHIAHETSCEIDGTKTKIVVVNDPELSDDTKAALAEVGFLHDNGAWWKISIVGLISNEQLISEIKDADIPATLKESLIGAVSTVPDANNENVTARFENLFSPAKLISSAAPCYIVSIRQHWAQHFFDIPVGGQTLMDLNEKLHLGIEGAYYCSAHNTHVAAPGRVLWYVSGKGSMSIKACSHLEERAVGVPKELYTRFRHLGVFQWKHVLETVKGKLDHPLMAFRFSRTERFARPVTLAELNELDIPLPQNPRRITAEQFAAIYKRGMSLQA